MTKLSQVHSGAYVGRIAPFFWQHGEDHAILLRELQKIRESGVQAFCVEARPHPDFAGAHWWRDMDVLMAQAREHRMQVWLLDDAHFPTGYANGAFAGRAAHLRTLFLAERHTDVLGPMPGATLLVEPYLQAAEELVAVVAVRRAGLDSDRLLSGEVVDLTAQVRHGFVRWDVPAGVWRVFTLFTTHAGEGREAYFNILDSRSIQVLLEEVYAPHFARYGQDFGKTFMGFFSDEPEFANVRGYDFQARLGERMPFIPWSAELEERLKTRWGADFRRRLPMLWYAGEGARYVRYDYMQAATLQLQHAFSDQVAGWCRERNAMHVGHIIEDDNVHARLGCSTGHYFRSLSGMDMAGIDVVLMQIMPGFTGTIHQWVASDRDGEFFHFGLAKLGGSLAHIDPKKKGRALCEIFGAYGWQEGMRQMKYLADHMLVRGINWFVPHGFSPATFPDADCPPHFYAQGHHAQFPFFQELMRYMHRLGELFSDGVYLADVAVLYHGESEWAGAAMPFQKPVRVLMEAQIGVDVLPNDLFAGNFDHAVQDGALRVGGAAYRALVLPCAAYIPEAMLRFVLSEEAANLPVMTLDSLPEGICEELPDAEALLARFRRRVQVISLAALADAVRSTVDVQVSAAAQCPGLRVYPYGRTESLALLCFNESLAQEVNTKLYIRLHEGIKKRACWYDAWCNRATVACVDFAEDGLAEVRLRLAANESIVLWFGEPGMELSQEPAIAEMLPPLEGTWRIYAEDTQDPVERRLLQEIRPGQPLPDLTSWAIDHGFSGTFHYETVYDVTRDTEVRIELQEPVDAAQLFVNDVPFGKRIGPPFHFDAMLRRGGNRISIALPTTPVWKIRDEISALAALERVGFVRKPVVCRLACPDG